jgi:hypothetical protein
MTIFKRAVEVLASRCHRTIPEVAGMIWEEELAKNRRGREQRAFFLGVITACFGIALVCWGLSLITGGPNGACP